MIPVPVLGPANEPPHFDLNCRQPGTGWLAAHPALDPHDQSDWWSQFQPALAKHFSYRCGWQATAIQLEGIVEHMFACGLRKKAPSPFCHLAFEWSNYRYATGRINSRKGTLDDQVLDPVEVLAGWFEVLIPSFRLVATDQIPIGPLRTKAQTTIVKLHLDVGTARLNRWLWYKQSWNAGNPDIPALLRDAPLVADAVQKAQAQGVALPDPTTCEPQITIALRRRRFAPRPRRSAPP